MKFLLKFVLFSHIGFVIGAGENQSRYLKKRIHKAERKSFEKGQTEHNDETNLRKTLSNTQDDLIKFGFDVAAVNSLIGPFVEGLFPILTNSLEQNLDLEVTESTGTCCNIGDVGGRITSFMRGFTMDPITENDVSIAVSPGPAFPDHSVRLNMSTGRIKAGFSEIGAVAGFALGFPIECTISLAVELDITSISFIFDLFSESSESNEFILRATDLTLEGIDLTMEPLVDSSSSTCSLISTIIGTLINLLSNSFEALIIDSLTQDLLDFTLSQMPDSTIDIPAAEPVNIVKNNTLTLDFKLPSFFVESNSIVARTTLGLEAILNTPSWRAGRKRSFSLISENAFPEPTIANLVNANIGSDGVNYLVDMLWYLAWSDLATDEKSATSPLCQPTTDDPCPLPPFRQEIGIGDTGFLPLFLLGSRRSFILSGVMQPPRLDFETGSLVKGTTQAVFSIEGVSFGSCDIDTILNMTANVEFLLSSLEFDESAGSLSGLQIEDFSFDDFEIEESLPFREFPLNIALQTVERVLNRQILSGIIDSINEAVSDALSSILSIPTIPDFPTTGQSLEISLTDVEMKGESGTVNSQSYASLGASISMDIISTPTVENPTVENPTIELKLPDDDIRDKLMNTMIEWSTESIDNPNAHFTWSYQNSELDIFESRVYYFDSTSKLVERVTND